MNDVVIPCVLGATMFVSVTAALFGLENAMAQESAPVVATELEEPPPADMPIPVGAEPTALPPVQTDFDRIGATEAEHTKAQFDYLTKRGWQLDYENPASQELWRRTIDLKTFCVNVDTAIAIQVALTDAEEEQNLLLKWQAEDPGIQ